jgi:hypothetical protein
MTLRSFSGFLSLVSLCELKSRMGRQSVAALAKIFAKTNVGAPDAANYLPAGDR